MAIGILCILLGSVFLIISSISEKIGCSESPIIEDDAEFWEYHVKLAGITDPREREAFKRAKKRELIERERKRKEENKQ